MTSVKAIVRQSSSAVAEGVYNVLAMKPFDVPEWFTFPKATIMVAVLAICVNVLWYLTGKPVASAPNWATSPSVLAADVVIVTVGIALAIRYRTRRYRLLVVVYAMLLGALLGAIHLVVFHEWYSAQR